MAAINFPTSRLAKAVRLVLVFSLCQASVRGAQVAFDLPSVVECRDVTSKEFADAHPNLKVVEAQLRISARMIEGTPDEIVEFFYVLKTNRAIRIRDYSPNTTLESSVAEDHIEVTDAKENTQATGLDAHVAYKPLLFGGSHNRNSKKSESSHYKQIAAKDLVLASGTIDREHGVFFRLRPSRTDSLEGGKQFMIVAAVPKTWRGGLCTISCEARTTKRSLLSTSVIPSGTAELQVGMYMAGDVQAAALAEDLRVAQEDHAQLATQGSKRNVVQTLSTQTVGMITGKTARQREQLSKADQTLSDLRKQLNELEK